MNKVTFSAMFPLVTTKSYVLIIHWNRLDETIPMNGHNIGFG